MRPPVRALWFEGDARFSLRREDPGEVAEGWCRIQTLFSALSPGTERLVYSGRVPVELHEAMRCPYMGGSFPFPVKYGYSLVGRIVEGPEARLGQLVHVLHPHQSQCVVRLGDTFPLPAGVPPARATLASNLETAVNAVWDAQVALGERVLVVGFGCLGTLVARLVSGFPSVKLEIVEKDKARREKARQMGFEAHPPERRSADFDLAVHASATAEGLQHAIEAVGFEGRIIELSWYGNSAISLKLGGTFHSQRKALLSSQVSRIAACQRARWDTQRRKRLVFSLLEQAEFDTLLPRRIAFDQLPAACGQLLENAGGGAGLVEYPSEEPQHV